MKHLPPGTLDDLQSMHKDFIWDGKRAKIKHCTLIEVYTDGGLIDVDLVSKFYITKIYLDQNDASYRKLSFMDCSCR